MKYIIALSAFVSLCAAQVISFGNEQCNVSGMNTASFTAVDDCIRGANLHNDRALWVPIDGSCTTPCTTSSVVQICGGAVPPNAPQRWVSSAMVAATVE